MARFLVTEDDALVALDAKGLRWVREEALARVHNAVSAPGHHLMMCTHIRSVLYTGANQRASPEPCRAPAGGAGHAQLSR